MRRFFMPYTVSKKLTVEARGAVEKLLGLYNDRWATNYIESHQYRCADDVTNVYNWRPNARVLNIGGAPYLFEAIAGEYNLDVVSLDLDPDRHTQVVNALNIDVRKIDFEMAGQRKEIDLGYFDMICLCEVLEHMRVDLIGLLKDVKTRISESAIVYITTPNHFYARRFFGFTLAGRSGPSLIGEWRKLAELGHMGHVREYSRKELAELFEFCGFETVKVDTRNRSDAISKSFRMLIPSLLCAPLERLTNRFAQELVFYLRPS